MELAFRVVSPQGHGCGTRVAPFNHPDDHPHQGRNNALNEQFHNSPGPKKGTTPTTAPGVRYFFSMRKGKKQRTSKCGGFWLCHFMCHFEWRADCLSFAVAHGSSNSSSHSSRSVSHREHATSCHFMPLHATSSGVKRREVAWSGEIVLHTSCVLYENKCQSPHWVREMPRMLLQQNGALEGLLQPHGSFLRPGPSKLLLALLGNTRPNKGQK